MKYFIQAKAHIKALEDGTLEAIVATDDLDRHGEILNIDGLDIKEFKKNPVVLWAHDYSHPPIAKAVSIRKHQGQLISKMQFADYPFAQLIYKLYKDGFMNAFSIGFIPTDNMMKNEFTKSEMLEYSAVPVPANANALARAKSLGYDISFFEKEKDVDKVDNFNNNNGMDLSKILAKAVGDLTLTEVAILKTRLSELSEEDKKKFASVLEVKAEEKKEASTDEIVEKLASKMDEKLDGLKKEISEKYDPIVNKDINLGGAPVLVKGKDDVITKEKKFLYFVKSVKNNDFSVYKTLPKTEFENEQIKAGVMNTTDQEAVLPPADFIAEVERLEEQYGVARRFATVKRSTKGKGIEMIMGDDDLEIYDTAEKGVKKTTKLTYSNMLLTWRKFTGLLPMSEELDEDSAIDLFRDASTRFARAYARKEDEMVFMRATGAGNLYPGVVKVSGTNQVVIDGDSIEDVKFDDLSKAIYGVPTPSASRGRFYFNRTIMGVLQRVKDTQGRYVLSPGPDGGVTGTIWGFPYELTEILPSLDQDSSSTAFIVFGDLSYVTLGERTDLRFEMFNTGTVQDPDDESADFNLLTQDGLALRAVKRMNSRVRLPGAFSVIRTGSAAS